MADRAPLMFKTKLGGLFPANRAAEEALRSITGLVKATLTGGRANERRRSLYWSVAALVVPILNDLHRMTLDENDLHAITREKLDVGERITLPSGESYFKPRSTSAKAMNEAERSEYTTRALEVWATWTGVDVETLRHEGGMGR